MLGSFEIPNQRLARTMLSQYAGINLNVHQLQSSQFDIICDSFEQLPMYFLRYFGSTNIDNVIDAMEYAVYVYDVEHIILDNLQFMLSSQHKGGYDKFDIQDRALDMLRSFATHKNVHITLVSHPRKEHDKTMLGIASVFGSGKITQEADNIIILQNGSNKNNINNNNHNVKNFNNSSLVNPNNLTDDLLMYSDTRRLEVRKNRYDGDLGYFEYKYHKDKARVVEIGQENNIHNFGFNLPIIKHSNTLNNNNKNNNNLLNDIEFKDVKVEQVNSSSQSNTDNVIITKTKRIRKPKQSITSDILTE